jgi:hypothetical protein
MTSDDKSGTGFSGTLKLIAILIVLAIALLAVLLVFDVIPRSVFSDTAGKLIALAGIGALVSVAIWAISGRSKGEGSR